MTCVKITNPIYLNKKDIGEFKMNIYQKTVIIICAVSALAIFVKDFILRKRLSNYFVSSHGTLCQSINKQGRLEIREMRKNIKECSKQTKLIRAGKLFKNQLEEVLKVLEIGKVYSMISHIYPTLQRQEKKEQNIKIIYVKEKNTVLLFEIISFLGIKDFLSLLFDKNKRENLFKKMYKIKFKRIK